MFAFRSRRSVATVLAAAQLFAVAHLALVAHTSSLSGGVASRGHAIEEHFDAVAHRGAHAHTPSQLPAGQGEEHCAVLALLSASSAPASQSRAVPVVHSTEPLVSVLSSYAPTRRERLLAAPKASPPSSLQS